MPKARKGTNAPKTFPNGMTAKQMKRKKPIDKTYMSDIKPLTDNQKAVFKSYSEGKNILLHGEQELVRLLLHYILPCRKSLTTPHPMIK